MAKKVTKADIVKQIQKAAEHPNTDPKVRQIALEELAKIKVGGAQ